MDSQIVGAPSWVATERYDIVAKAPAAVTTADEMRPLLRALLAERFKLATHRETRDMPVFALVRARADRFGPGFRTASVDCAAQPMYNRLGVNLTTHAGHSSCAEGGGADRRPRAADRRLNPARLRLTPTSMQAPPRWGSA